MKLTLGQRIYYTGDMANCDDCGTVVAVRPPDRWCTESYDIDLDDGRTLKGIHGLSFEPGPGRRFMPLDEYHQDRTERIRRSIESMTHIRAHVYANGKHSVYALCSSELAGFVALHGWTVTNDIEGLTDADRAELAKLEALDSLVIPEFPLEGMTWQRWHELHEIASNPCLTPDL